MKWFNRKSSSVPENTETAPEKELLKKVREIHIRSRRMVNDVMAGEYQSAFRGRGMEFDTVREYQEGDEERSIDWNVTARFGHPYVKSYVEERELTVIFLVDISASHRFGTRQQLKMEIAAEFCGVLAFNAMKKNDRVGLILFSDQIELFVPPQKGRTHVLRVIRELLLYQPKREGTSINNALEYFNRVIKKRAVVFLVSDFLEEGYLRNMNLTNQRHDLVAIEITDPAENKIPNVGLINLRDPETGDVILVDSNSGVFREHYNRIRYQFDEKRESFRKAGIDHLIVRTDRPYERDLIRFFKQRRTKL